jgi:hypothetical protein
MTKFVLPALAAVLVAIASAGVQAGGFDRPCTAAPKSQWLSMEAMQAKVEAQGYRVQKAKMKNTCGEIYARDKEGSRVELFVDPTSGEIIGSKKDS